MKKFYSYPCQEHMDCPDFIDGWKKMSFKEFCETYCAHCPDCIEMDIPYEEIEKGSNHNGNA